MNAKLAAHTLLVGICIVTLGCDDRPVDENRTTVSGTVTFNGKPLPAGSISFESSAAGIAASVTIQDGRYTTDRAPIGQNAVGIDTSSIQLGNPAKYVGIPEKYADSGTSGLTVDVKPGANKNVNFDLKP